MNTARMLLADLPWAARCPERRIVQAQRLPANSRFLTAVFAQPFRRLLPAVGWGDSDPIYLR